MSDLDITIDCMYSCSICGIVKAHVKVPAREDSQNVVDWMKKVASVVISNDHSWRSPDYHAKVLSEVYIPITGSKIIGGSCEQ